jgi:hypothetical protein
MVNTRRVKERLMRGVYVGVGSFAASTAEGLIEENLGTGDVATSLAQAGLGLGLSVGADTVFSSPSSLPNDAVEFAGYGMQGAGFSNLGRSFQTGQSLGQTVRVTTEGSSGNSSGGSDRAQAGQFSLDV